MRLLLVAVLASGCARDASPRGREPTAYEQLEARTPEVLGAIDRLAALLRGTAGGAPCDGDPAVEAAMTTAGFRDGR